MEHTEAIKTAKKNVCGNCFGNLVIMQNKDGYYLRCVNGCNLEEVGLDTAWNHPSKRERECLAERNALEMTMGISNDKAVALRKYALTPRLDKAQAIEVLKTCWPTAPEQEVMRAALLCATYQLNPLMKHIFLVPYGKGEQTQWSLQIGIGATRLVASRRGPVTYIDGPRIMTDAEQKSIRGKVEADKVWAITKLGGKNGATAVGYGNYNRNEEPKGVAKGNSRENMAMIRSERQALDRLYPAEMPMPAGDLTVDETYEPSPLQVIEAEARDISDAKELPADNAASPLAAPEVPPAEETPPPAEIIPYPKLYKQFGDMLTVCWVHGDAWTVNKFKKRSHTMGDNEWCNFSDRINKPRENKEDPTKPLPCILEEICKKAGIEDALSLNEKLKKEYGGRTLSKITEEELLTVLEGLS